MYLYEEDGEKVELDQEYLQGLYDTLNDEYFNGKLGPCKIGTFSGRKVRTLGYFKIPNIRINRRQGRMFTVDGLTGDIISINQENFYDYCEPEILLNANYKWTPDQMEATMLHEMCHYWTYIDGWAPRQAHGTDFRYIGKIVSDKSKGKITIQRLADAEQMKQLELKPELQDAMDRRKENKLINTYVILMYWKDGNTRLSRTTSWKAISETMNFYANKVLTSFFLKNFVEPAKIEVYKNRSVTESLESNEYLSNSIGMLKWWNVSDQPDFIKNIQSYDHLTYDFEGHSDSSVKLIDSIERFIQQVKSMPTAE